MNCAEKIDDGFAELWAHFTNKKDLGKELEAAMKDDMRYVYEMGFLRCYLLKPALAAAPAITDPLDTPRGRDNHGDRTDAEQVALEQMRERIGTGLDSINSFYATVCDVLKAEAIRVNEDLWSVSLAGALVDKLWPMIETLRAVATQSSPAQVGEKGGKEGDGERQVVSPEVREMWDAEEKYGFPLTGNRKISRAALATPETSPLVSTDVEVQDLSREQIKEAYDLLIEFTENGYDPIGLARWLVKERGASPLPLDKQSGGQHES